MKKRFEIEWDFGVDLIKFVEITLNKTFQEPMFKITELPDNEGEWCECNHKPGTAIPCSHIGVSNVNCHICYKPIRSLSQPSPQQDRIEPINEYTTFPDHICRKLNEVIDKVNHINRGVSR